MEQTLLTTTSQREIGGSKADLAVSEAFEREIFPACRGDERSRSTQAPCLDKEPHASDETLFAQLSDGNQEALGILFRRYAGMVRSVANRILRDASEADDLVQEVFLFIFRKASLFDSSRCGARSWIVQVTYHRAFDRRRYLTSRRFYTSNELNEELTLAGASDEMTMYDRTLDARLGSELLQSIKESLSENQIQVLQLYFFEGFAFEEIAQRLGQTAGNVLNHYYRGLEKMRRKIFASKLRIK